MNLGQPMPKKGRGKLSGLAGRTTTGKLPYGLKSVPSKPGKKGKSMLPVDTSPGIANRGRKKPY